MNPTKPGLPLARTERLCDYELPDAQPPAMPPLFPDLASGENWGLSWWLWMDDVGKHVVQHYDHWRDRLLHASVHKRQDD